MIAGHYATALLPLAGEKGIAPSRCAPIWAYLACAMLLDVVFVLLALAGVEHLQSEAAGIARLLDFSSASIDMTYSHDLAPVAAWALAAACAAGLWRRSLRPALWCGGLVLLHEACDLLAGFEHYLFRPQSASVGLDLYRANPPAAYGIELIMTAAALAYFIARRGREFTASSIARLAALLLTLPAASVLGVLVLA